MTTQLLICISGIHHARPYQGARNGDQYGVYRVCGCGGLAPNADEVILCRKWIQLRADKSLGVRARANSYVLKHEVEHWVEKVSGRHHYISNGAFIAAAIELGYDWCPANPRDNYPINAIFNMSFSEKEVQELRT